MAYAVSQAINLNFWLMDPADDLHESGKLNADWTKQAYKNGATNAATVVIDEVGSTGAYRMYFTPDAAGDWMVSAKVTVGTTVTYHEFGPFTVEVYDLDAIQALIGTTADLTSTSSLFGWLLRLRCFAEKKWAISGNTLTIYNTDNTTALFTFTLAPNSVAPISRTPA